MSDDIKVITNNVPRDVIYGYELSANDRLEFEYIDWAKVENGESNPEFFRYKGDLYHLAEFMTTHGMPTENEIGKWDAYYSDSFFSGIVLKYADDYERVVIGRFIA